MISPPQRVLLETVDDLIAYAESRPRLSPLLPGLAQLAKQAARLHDDYDITPIGRIDIALDEAEAETMINIVSRIPSLEQLFGMDAPERARQAFAQFLANVHSCGVASIFDRHQELVRRLKGEPVDTSR